MKLTKASALALLMYGTIGRATFAAPAPMPATPPVTAPARASGPVAQSTVQPTGSRSPFDGDDPVVLDAALRQVTSSYKLSGGGAALLKAGDVHGARAAFEQALALEPSNPDALYGLARCAGASGDAAGELGYYRRVVYRQARSVLDMDGSGFLETKVPRLMEFALALDQAGQAGEAVAVYDHAAGLLDAAGGGAHSLGVDVPYLGDGPGQVPYTPQALQAMAHLALGVESFSHQGPSAPEPLGHFRQAVQLAPDSAAACYYLGKCLYAMGGSHGKEAKAMLDRAVLLGDDRTAEAAKVHLKFLH